MERTLVPSRCGCQPVEWPWGNDLSSSLKLCRTSSLAELLWRMKWQHRGRSGVAAESGAGTHRRYSVHLVPVHNPGVLSTVFPCLQGSGPCLNNHHQLFTCQKADGPKHLLSFSASSGSKTIDDWAIWGSPLRTEQFTHYSFHKPGEQALVFCMKTSKRHGLGKRKWL